VNIENKVAIVTGGSSGIGQAVSLLLAKQGFRLAVVGHRHERVNQAVRKLSAISEAEPGPLHLALALDVTNESDMHEMVDETIKRFGRIDVLVACAGIGKKAGSRRVFPHPTESLPFEEWKEIIDVNLTGIFLSNRAVLPIMMRQRSGHIMNVGSSTTPYGLRGQPFAPAYCASKFGVVGLTESLAAEVASYQIRVQVLFPGPVETRLVHQTMLARPFGGAMSVDNFAKAVVWLVQQPFDAVIVHPHLIPFKGTREARPLA
jgi:NAD(P)-dependent dehydrogenase (short-subunit alcohol dehydrogenase family)